MIREAERGVVLAMVLVLVLVLTTSIVVFMRRSLVDTYIVRNRDAAAQAEALARGGVQLGIVLLLEDLLQEQARGEGSPLERGDDEEGESSTSGSGDTEYDLWSAIGDFDLPTADGAVLRLEIEDAGARLNLNSLVDFNESGEGEPDRDAEEFLVDLIEKVIEDLPLPPGEKAWDPRELAENLLDYLDSDDVRRRGGPEGDYYESLDPPQEPANRPMLAVEELRVVEGFERVLADAMAHYVTVYPLVPVGQGVNLNTAPAHVLASLSHGAGGNRRLLSESVIRNILQARQDGQIVCDDTAVHDRCVNKESLRIEGNLYPPAVQPSRANAFRIRARVRVGEIERSVIAVVDRTVPAEPRLLSYRVE